MLWADGGYNPLWLGDSHDFIFKSADSHRVLRMNAVSRQAPKELLDLYPDEIELVSRRFNEYENAFHYSRITFESDIWMIEFE